MDRQGYTVQRRLRLKTLQFEVAPNFTELYESADPEVILTVLTHKVSIFNSPTILDDHIEIDKLAYILEFVVIS
jgi:hypothetical protein